MTVVLALLGTAVAAPSAHAQVLSRGDSGPAVATWQDRLNGWLAVERTEQGRLAVDGIFGRRTEAATRDFQDARDITVDGIVGPETRSALDAALTRGDASDGARPILARGDSGPAVATWQEKVNDWLRVNRPEQGVLVVDGVYGPKTEAATIMFQRAQEILIDGKVGPQTRSTFDDTPVATDSGSEEGTEPLLLRGSRGDAVADWQRKLNEVADAGLAVDGIYGPNTAAATQAFQRAHGILVDGIVGPQTRTAMEQERA